MNKKLTAILALLLFFLIVVVLTLPRKNKKEISSPATSLLTINPKSNMSYSAWIPYWKEDQAIESIENIKKGKLSEVLPVWYELNEDGLIARSKEKDGATFVEALTSKKIKIIPTVTNSTPSGFDSLRVSKMLKNKDSVIEELVNIAIENEYSGWDLDLEQITQNDKEEYTNFAMELSNRLHSNQMTLSITVHAQSEKNSWKGTKGQDIEKLSIYADSIRVMVYDFHNTDSDAGPITPTENLIETINFMLNMVPKEKLVICLPTYGYDWSNEKVTPLQYEDAKKLVDVEQVIIERDEESFELTGSYQKDGIKHTIWYQDSESTLQKINIIKKFGITNICFWHLGDEDQELWEKI